MKLRTTSPFAVLSRGGFASLIFAIGSAQGADISYKSGLTSPTEFTTASNWVGDVAPTSADIPAWLTDVDAVTAGAQESTGGTITVASPISVLGMKFQDSTGAITLGGSEITLGASGMQIGWENVLINNVVAGSSGLSVSRHLPGSSAGVLNFGAANTFSGGVTLNNGASVRVSNALAFGTNAITAAGNSAITVSTSFANNISVPTGINLTLNGGFNNLNGIISGDGRVTANNTVQLRGTNTYTGGTTTSSGFLCIDRDANLGAVPLSFSANNITINATGTISNYIATGPVTLDANRGITLSAGATGGFDVSNQSLRVNGVISGDGSLYKGGNNTLILPVANLYTGGTRLFSGTIQVSNSAALGTGPVTIAGNSTINAQSNFANNITINSTFGLGFGGGFSLVQGVISGLGRIQSSNNGVVTGDNTYEGGTNITGGFFCISKDSSLGLLPASPVANNINLSGGGSLSNFPASFGPTVTINANRGITIAAGTTGGFDAINGSTLALNGVISGAGGFRTSSSSTTGTIVLNGLNTYTGKTILGRNTTVISSLKNVGDLTGSSLGNPADAASGTIDLGSGTIATTLRYAGTGNTSNRVINLTPTTGGVSIEQASTSGTLELTGGVTAQSTGNKTLTLLGSTTGLGNISGPINDPSVSVNVSATSTAAAAYLSGATTISVNNASLFLVGTSISGTGIPNGTTVSAISGNTVTLSQATNAAGTINSTLTFGSYASGQTTVNLATTTGVGAGAVVSGPGIAPGTTITAIAGNTITLSTATTAALANATATTFTGFTTGITKSGTGTWIISGTNTYTGFTDVVGGTLGGSGSTGTDLLVYANGTLSPGAGIGTFKALRAAFVTGGVFTAEINSSSIQADKLVVSDTVNLDGATLALSDIGAGSIPSGSKLTLVDYTGGSLSGTFTGVAQGSTINLGSNSFTISYTDGSKVTLTSTTVAPSGFSGWATTNAGGQSPSEDFDKDGVSNGVEYFMNSSAGFTTNPVLNASGSITWTNGGNIPSSAYGTQYVIQTSSDLLNWANVNVADLSTNSNGPNGSLTYTLTGTGKRFVRLKVTPL